jgi:hypothetical protein
MTMLGKVFVFVVLALSLLCCSYALLNYTNAINFGWDKKGKEMDEVAPSEIDKRKPVLEKLAKEKGQVVADWTYARDNLAQTEGRVAENQLEYTLTLERLQSEPKDITIKSLKRNPRGALELDPKTGRPELDKVVAKKSYDKYLQELGKLFTQIKAKQKEVAKTISAEQEVTEQLNGKTVRGKQSRGLYALIEVELGVQHRASAEIDDIKPKLFQELVESQLRLKRNRALKVRRDQLKKFKESGKETGN